MKKRVCIIGAGPSGLAQLQAFQAAADKGADIPEIVCYEKQPDWGGLWRYTWRTGVDEYSNPCHGSMYRYLWSNGPKEGIEFADYTYEEHFGKRIASYPPRAVIVDYITGRSKKSGVRKYCKFNHVVRDVRVVDGGFEVTARDGVSDTEERSVFDHVIVATGHFSFPNVPQYPGFESFNGRILHSHDFRDACQFKDHDILILGTSYSAEDIGSQCWKYGCKSVTVSYRTRPTGLDWPDKWQEVPKLDRVEGRTAHFIDGSSKEVDSIILCTGYKHHYPFLPDDLRLKTVNRLAPNDLYKGVVLTGNPDIFYIGMQDQWYTFNMFDTQAWWVRDVIMGRIALPDAATMEADWKQRQADEDAMGGDHGSGCIVYQGAYMGELAEETDYPPLDIEAAKQTLYDWQTHKHQAIMGYRDFGDYVSPMTGTASPAHHTRWVDALDDSLERYLEN